MSSPSIRDVAKQAGVSLASVSQVFRNPKRAGIEVRNKVLKAAEKLGYVPKFIKKRTEFGNVGLLIDRKRSPFGEFYSHIIMGILEQAKKLKWNISIETYNADLETIPPMIATKKVDGVILLSKHEDVFIKKLIDRKVPYCVADYASEKLSHNYVIPDWFKGGYLATEYLIKKGHKKIAMIHSPLEKGRVSLERVAGYNKALDKYNLPFTAGYMQDGEFSYHKAYEVCKKILACSPRPTAIFCATDVMAMGAYKAIKEADLQIPNNISIVGFDNIDLPYFMDPLEPPLTTIDQSKERIGAEALKIVHKIITSEFRKDEPESKILPVNIVEKKSVRSL